ncbi:MAG: TonB-dependent receptor [Muribaculaceae bacterium]|nr:TonB-dependent receptor [Muribaculaceae bacterium]
MKKLIFSLLLSVVTVISMSAQLSDSHISGHVINKTTKDHLPYITIRLLNTSIGTTTDATGHYYLKNIPVGKYTIEASSIGYLPQTFNISIQNNQTQEIKFELEEDVMQLEQVVVTGNKSEVKRRNSSSLVNVLGNQIFDMVSGACLVDGLSFQPGVRVENNCQNCGFTQVRINGLDGHYSQILMNSRPVFSALAGVYGLEQIPANMIDRVEVMRGGGSALFGASAIGGTINIITKDPVSNSAEVAHTITSQGISGSLDNNTTLNASVVTDNHKLGAFIYGQSRNRNGYDYDNDGYTELAKLKAQTLGIRSFLRTSDNTKFTLEYHTTNEYRRGGDNINLPAHEAHVAEQTEHSIHSGDVSFDYWSQNLKHRLNVFTSIQSTDRNSYYGSNENPEIFKNAYGTTKDMVVVSGAQYTRNWERLFFMPAELIGGVEYNYNYLHDVALGYNHDALQKVNIYSAYLQNEWRNDKWGFLIGARIDRHSIIKKAIISPRANIRYNPNKNINFRLSYSTGFRSPQAYDEDFHVAVVGGDRVVTILAPDLKHETSRSLSLSGDFYHNFGGVMTNILIEGFYTDLNNVFALRKLQNSDEAGNTVMERYNGAGATVFGLNIEGKAILSSKYQLQAGVTLQKSRYKEPEYWSENENVKPEERLFRTPDIYGYMTFKYNPIKPLTLSLSGTFSGNMLVQHMESSGTPVDVAVTTPAFADINFKIAYDFKVFQYATMQVNAGVLNMFNSYQKDFDKGMNRDSGYIYGPMTPRSIFAGVKVTI